MVVPDFVVPVGVGVVLPDVVVGVVFAGVGVTFWVGLGVVSSSGVGEGSGVGSSVGKTCTDGIVGVGEERSFFFPAVAPSIPSPISRSARAIIKIPTNLITFFLSRPRGERGV